VSAVIDALYLPLLRFRLSPGAVDTVVSIRPSLRRPEAYARQPEATSASVKKTADVMPSRHTKRAFVSAPGNSKKILSLASE
jgi:hypothetical protein